MRLTPLLIVLTIVSCKVKEIPLEPLLRPAEAHLESLSHPVVVDGAFQVGRYDKPFSQLNFRDASPGGLFGGRLLRGARLKEWQAFQFFNGRWFGVVALFDAKVLGLVQAKIYDTVERRKILFERKVLSASLTAPDQILNSTMNWSGGGAWMHFETRLGEDRAGFAFDLPGDPTLRGTFTADYTDVEPVVVCLPFNEKRAMYSQKGVAPLSGELWVGPERIRFTPETSYALLDDHRGYYPRLMKWDWVTTGGFRDDGTLWGLNLTRNQCLRPEQHNENTLWVGGKAYPLPPITFERVGEGAGSTWYIRDTDGRVALHFEVEMDGRVDINALVVQSRYRGPFGRLSGTVSTADGPEIRMDGAFAMGEKFWLKA